MWVEQLIYSLFCAIDEGYIHAFRVENEFNQMCNTIEVNIGTGVPKVKPISHAR